jgi:hypothetical protein
MNDTLPKTFTYKIPDTGRDVFIKRAKEVIAECEAHYAEKPFETIGMLESVLKFGMEMAEKAKPAKTESYYDEE